MFYSQILPQAPGSAAAARALVERVRAELSQQDFDDARLLISELVANAVEHAQADGDIEVRVGVADGVLRVEVIDPGPGFEYVPRADGASVASGWGLHFTDRVASRWAIDVGERTCVWFELDRA